MAKQLTPKEALKKYFGYDTFRPMQEEIIETVIKARDAMVIMPTGGGKSICFQIPGVILPGVSIVVSPLIALMKDQVESLKANGISSAFLNSSLTMAQQSAIQADVRQGKIKLLYVSPEKLLTESFFYFLKEIEVSLFAIDEAHCISAWGHDFRPEYTQLSALKKDFPKIPVIALTATADKLTRSDISRQLEMVDHKSFVTSFDRPNLSLNVVPARKRVAVILDFVAKRPNQSGIVYCLSRKGTEDMAAKLNAKGIDAEYYHAGMTTDDRSRVQEDFIRDKTQIICATVAFGMGIDKSNIRWVIHYNLPKNIESYYQEIGRAGRDGLKSDTMLFYSYADVAILQGFIDDSGQKEIQQAKLERIQQYSESPTCRRKVLLAYFNEKLEKDCGNCDVCKNPPASFDGTLHAQKALSAVTRTGQKVPMGILIDILRGSGRYEIVEHNYHKLKTYGVGADTSYFDWNQYIMQLINQGYLEIAYDDKQNLRLTDHSRDVLFSGEKVKLIQVKSYKDRKESKEVVAPKKIVQKDMLFEELRALRKEIADKENMPAYIVFSDVSLREMAGTRPINDEQMLEITGVGEHKLQTYGRKFIAKIIDFEKREKATGSVFHLTHEFLKKGYSPEQIAMERGVQSATIFSHIAHLYDIGKFENITKYVSLQDIDKVREAVVAIGSNKELKPIYDTLGKKIEYTKIRLALSYIKKNK